MLIITKPGSSQIIEIPVRSNINGQLLTGLVPGGVTIYYQRQGAAAPVLVALGAGVAGVYSSGGWVEIDSVNNPGVYQFGVPNAALAAGVNSVIFTVRAANALDKIIEITLTTFDLQSSASFIAFPAGAIEFTFTVTTPALIPIGGASVWISTDVGMLNIIWRGSTDAFGVARDVLNRKPWLDAGLYQFWVQDENYSGSNPTALVVS